MDEIIKFVDEDCNTTFRRNDDFHVENLEFEEITGTFYDIPNSILITAELPSYQATEVHKENTTQCSEICPPSEICPSSEIPIQLCPSPEIQFISLFDHDIDSILNTISQDITVSNQLDPHTLSERRPDNNGQTSPKTIQLIKRKLTKANQSNLKPQKKVFVKLDRNHQMPFLKPRKISNPEFLKL